MFENIGGKIKVIAKILCWIITICFVIYGIVMFVNSSHAYDDVRSTYIILGFVFILIGPLVAWASSCLIYGFGELIETNSEIAENICSYDQDFSDINEDTNYDNEPETATESNSISREAAVSDLQFKI